MRNLLLPAAFVFLPACGEMLYAEVEVEELCQEAANQEFEAMPTAGEFTIDREFEYPFEVDLTAARGLDGEAQLKHMLMRPGEGLEQLDFIDYAQVELRGPDGSNLPAVNIVNFQKGAPTEDGSIRMEGDKIDVMPYLETGMVRLKASLKGRFPTQPWKANIQTCMAVKARYPYLNAFNQM